MRYNFFCRLSSFESAKIYSIKNSEQNIDSSSFVDELMLNYAIEILVSTDPAFSKFKHKNNIRVYSGNNHIDVIQDGVGSLGLLIIEDHSCQQLQGGRFSAHAKSVSEPILPRHRRRSPVRPARLAMPESGTGFSGKPEHQFIRRA